VTGIEVIEMTSDSQGRITREPILTIEDVAAELRCSKAHVYHAVRGQVPGALPLPAIRMGRRVLVRRSSLEQWKIDSEARASGAIVRPSPEVHAARRMKG
jgi:excisionase family DNA binding protein